MEQVNDHVHRPFQVMSVAMNEALDHSMHVLEIKKLPEARKARDDTRTSDGDVEARAGDLKPGDAGFAQYLDAKVKNFYESRKTFLGEFCFSKGLKLEGTHFAINPAELPLSEHKTFSFFKDPETHKRNQRQLFLILEVSLATIFYVAARLGDQSILTTT